MTFDQIVNSLQSTKAEADVTFATDVANARDAYVLAGEAHILAETAWLQDPASETLAAAAAATWAALNTARDALEVSAGEAVAARATTLTDAWETIRLETLE